MSQAEVFFLKRADKSFGPYSLAQLKGLSDQGKLKNTDFISKSSDGPWKKLGEVTKNLFPTANPSNEKEPIDQEPFIAANANGGVFSSLDIGDLPPAIPPTSFSYAIPSQTHSRTHPEIAKAEAEDNEETQDVGWQWIVAPWLTENSKKRYGNLEKYITISKVVFRVVFVIAMVFVFLFVIGGVVLSVASVVLRPEVSGTSYGANWSTIVGVLITGTLMTLLIHLAYIGAMAGIDLLRLLIDVEENTRKRR